ncbi:MAG: menaquinone biosynthesis protein [Bacteroidetes bacterium]|nr:menaquinone biosynthesis protein [Bacteroidota bacterium]
METEIRIGAVSYLNTLPLLQGLRKHGAMKKMVLTTDYPARIAEDLLLGRIDIGLVPVAVIPRLDTPQMISEYCIGCNGPVASVAIFSECPIDELTCVWMDYQSRTSVTLARILLRDYWKVSPEIRVAHDDSYLVDIQGTIGGLVIGDRAFLQAQRSSYAYDLGDAWKKHTGLPFVFATWIANRPIDAAFISHFNDANARGLEDLDTIIREIPQQPYPLKKYFTENIQYIFDEGKNKGLQEFMRLLAATDLQYQRRASTDER